mgnify:CR=1 FL=1
MTTCVFITGTNAVGKSSVARAIIERCGGIAKVEDQVTYCADGKTTLAGSYLCKYGGVDRVTNTKGSSCTSELQNVVERGLAQRDIIFCEGSFMGTFGMNLTNAMFKANKHLVINLYADARTLYDRLNNRSKGKNGNGRDFALILKKQKLSAVSAVKWHEIGVKVLQINTAEYSPEQIVDTIYGVLAKL